MLTGDELRVLRDTYVLRAAEGDVELWAGIADELVPQAEWLAEVGLLERHYCRGCQDLHWRCSDAGVEAMQAHNAELASSN